jgi:signal transduction histidine kinase/sensor domain CHASE-containing protein
MSSASHTVKVLPLVAFMFFGVVTLALYENQHNHERELVLRHTTTSAEQLRIRVEGLMNARITSLEMLADRWVDREPADFSHQRFLGFAEALFRHSPGYTGLFWIDPGGVIQWTYPENEHVTAGGRRFSEYPHPRYAAALEEEKTGPSLEAMPCVPLDQGGFAFHVLRVLVDNGNLQGYLDGVFHVGRIMSLCLTPQLLNDFCVKVFEDGRIIYHHGYAGDLHEAAEEGGGRDIPRAAGEIRFGGKNWTIQLEPGLVSYPRGSPRNLPFLIFGLALSASLALLLHLLIHRMEMYKKSRDQALHEVNERKRAQEALRANEKALEALLAELTDKNTELESFVYTVSHDLKTPIVTIEGFIGALREDFGEILSEVGDKYLRYMSDAARKMEVLINDLLELSRVGRLSETKAEFSLGEPVADAIETLKPQIEAAKIAVAVQKDLPAVYAERKRMGQVMDNLLTNAVKYIGKDNPDPRIDVGCTDRNGEKVFWVRDNGIGIDQRYFDKIFQIFERLPAAKLASGGTGIGLTIVRRVIEKHGGRIWVTSELGKGSTFFFTLKDKEPEWTVNRQAS